ncbi:MAG TPA: hypothetical protein VM266_08350 [Solirubrobacteraceae bacterium]|nr:hypothetical protein [Solirubrobacteraceae bacterium]
MRAVTVRDSQIVVDEHRDPVAQAGEVLVDDDLAVADGDGSHGGPIVTRGGRAPPPRPHRTHCQPPDMSPALASTATEVGEQPPAFLTGRYRKHHCPIRAA